MHRVITGFVLATILTTITNGNNYQGYQVFEIHPKNLQETVIINKLKTNANLDFWTKVNKVGNGVHVMVNPEFQKEFQHYLETQQITYNITIENVESSIQNEKRYHEEKGNVKLGRIAFDRYNRHTEINAYLDQLAVDYADLVTVSTIGQSNEGRDVKIIKISTSGQTLPVKPVIFVEAGNHAREWIAPAFALYLINQLVENPENARLIEQIDWIILPNLNPDGYEYTWTTDRLWRKTRSAGTICDGADGNRNFGFHWMENGADSFECSEIYAGNEEFSEIETRNLRDILAATPNIKAFLSIHSYGQYMIYPYSYDDLCAENRVELQELGERTEAAIRAVRGTGYTVGCSTEVMYPAAGCSDDWAMGAEGIDIVFVFELPGGDYGFQLPASEILPVGVETFEGIKVIHDYILEQGN